MAIYLPHEQIKSAVLDAVRYAKVLAAGGRTPAGEQILVASLTQKLRIAASVWNQDVLLDEEHVEGCLRVAG